MKIAVVGGGSTYTPELVSGLAREAERLDVAELVLQDIDAERLEIVGGLAGRMLDRDGFGGGLTLTEDLDRAVDGADFVLVQIRVGGQRARLSDETVPLTCGCVGQETTGAGGLAKALRTVPVMLEIADRVRELSAQDAWIVDFTNPVGIVTRALLDAGHRAVGLCNVAIGFQRAIARMLDVEPGRVLVDQVGLNHLTWVRAVHVDGSDVLPGLIASHGDELADDAGGLPRELLEELGAVPSYYLRYFYAHDKVLADQRQGVPRAQRVAEIEAELLDMYRDPGLAEKPALLNERGGAYYSEAAVGLVASLTAGDGEAHEVDIRNEGTLGGLADDDVVEVPARVYPDRIEPLEQAPLAPELLGLVQHVAAYERVAVEAALSGDPADVRRALLAHPLIGQWDAAKELTELLRAASECARMSEAALLAVDGGATKTDLALVAADGSLLALERGPLSSPHYVGVEGSLDVLAGLLDRAGADAGLATDDGPVTELAQLLMAGLDLPSEVDDFHTAVDARGWSARSIVDNDTFAILRAGTEQSWGVAVVCGTGINCVGIAPDGRHARFPALGAITGDWGGGYDVGLAAVSAAARSEDGRGAKTRLEQAVPAYFGLSTPTELAEAIHRGRIPHRRIGELPPVVFAEAESDEAASAIVARLADEVVALARVALERLELTGAPVEVLLGGGLLRGNGTLEAAIEARLREVGGEITVHNTQSPPIVGAVLLGLDELGAGPEAQSRARTELGDAVAALEGRDG